MIKRKLVVPFFTVLLLATLSCLYWLHRRSSMEVSHRTGVDFPASTAAGLSGIAVTERGDVYISARKLNRVLKVSPDGKMSVVAGNGNATFSGDGGPSISASLAGPMSVALNSSGILFIADTGNNRVRTVDPKTGFIRTIAGNGTMGGRTGVPALSTGLYEPVSIAFDSNDNLYIGGTTAQGVRRIDAISGITSRVVGAALADLPATPEPAVGPFWVTAGKGGEIFFSDPDRNTVYWFDTATIQSRRLAGSALCGSTGDGGPASKSLLCFPEGLLVDKVNRLLIADSGNNRVRAVDLLTGIISTFAGNGEPGFSGDGGPAISAEINGPAGIAQDGQGNIYIADTGNDCVREVAAGTGVISTLLDGGKLVGLNPSPVR